MASLIIISQSYQHQKYRNKPQFKRGKTTPNVHSKHKHKIKRRRNHIYYDADAYKADHAASTSHSETSHGEDLPIDLSTVHRINRTIQDSFYTMSEVDPSSVSHSMRASQESKSWPLIPYKPRPAKSTSAHSVFSYFVLKELGIEDHRHIDEKDLYHEEPYVYYYDHEQEEQKIFYKQLNLNIDDILKKKPVKGDVEATELDIALNEYHLHEDALPDMQRYFILLYYNIKKSSITQLQQLWRKLYTLWSSKTKQGVPLPTIYINFENGEQPTNINHVFELLYRRDLKQVDLRTLKEVVREYYYQWHPKCIQYPETIKQSIFESMKFSENSMETADDDFQQLFGYKSDGFWSIADGDIPAALFRGASPSPSPLVPSELTPYDHEVDDDLDGNLFGFEQLKPKTAVFAGVFGVAATVGFRMLSTQ